MSIKGFFLSGIFVFLFSVVNIANAETNGWATPAKVTSFWCQGAKTCLIYGNFGNPGSCSQNNALIIDESTLWGALDADGKSNGGFNFVMSMVMTSQTAGKNFKCWIYGCQSAQGNTYSRCVQPGLE